MSSPFAWQITQMECDKRAIENALAALEETGRHLIDTRYSLSNLDDHITTGFQVVCSTASLIEPPEESLQTSRAKLRLVCADMENDLASLRRQESNYLAAVATEQAAGLDRQGALNTYGNSSLFRRWY